MNRRHGQSLLELVIASGVLAVSTVAALTLIVRTISVGQESKWTTEATNYAREGLEVVRMIRDTNWLMIDSNVADPFGSTNPADLVKWDDTGSWEYDDHTDGRMTGGYEPLGDGPGKTYVLVYDPTTDWRLVECTGGSCPASDYYLCDLGGYISQAVGTCSKRLLFKREVTIRLVTTDTATIGGVVMDLPYLDVVSRVEWTGSSRGGVIQLRTRLYNWR